METNNDIEKSHFSYYDVLIRSRNINLHANYTSDVENFILSKIKNIRTEDADNNDFTAQDLRNKLPDILKKKESAKEIYSRRVNYG